MCEVLYSPIIYPGGKRWLFKQWLAWIPAETQKMVSPFFGGGAMELNLALRGGDNWILSYNNHPVVSDLYKGYKRLMLKSRNFSTGQKTSSEVIIFSHDIADSLEYKPLSFF